MAVGESKQVNRGSVLITAGNHTTNSFYRGISHKMFKQNLKKKMDGIVLPEIQNNITKMVTNKFKSMVTQYSPTNEKMQKPNKGRQ